MEFIVEGHPIAGKQSLSLQGERSGVFTACRTRMNSMLNASALRLKNQNALALKTPDF